MSINRFERTGRRPSMLSEWQRRIGEGSSDGHDPRCRMIDADGVYWCLRCRPPVPLAIFEEFQDQRVSIDDKPHACTEQLGRLLHIPAFVAKNHPDRQDPYTVVKNLRTGKTHKYYLREFADWIMDKLYGRHEDEFHGGEYTWNAERQRSEKKA